jgi:hypothetical protein
MNVASFLLTFFVTTIWLYNVLLIWLVSFFKQLKLVSLNFQQISKNCHKKDTV